MDVDALFDTRVLTILLGILIPVLLYWFSTRNHDYWKKRGIPFSKPYPFLGSLPESFKKNFEELELDRYTKLGRLYGIYEANAPTITVAEPAIIRNILVKDFHFFSNRRNITTGDPILDNMMSMMRGENWKRVRTIVSPTFSTGKIKRVMSIFQECAKMLVQNLKTTSEKGTPIDVLRIYGAFTMDIIASAAFSTKIDSLNDQENVFVKMAKEGFGQEIKLKFILFFMLPPWLMRLLRINIFFKKSSDFFHKVTLEIIEERRKTGQTRNDFLQLLLDTATEVVKEEKCEGNTEDITANYGSDTINHSVFKGNLSKHLSMDELIAQCVIFFLAGYHTTATTLGITTYLLAINQNEQEKVYNEIKEVLSETEGELTYEAVQKMKYLDNVISETLRIYSPALRLERTAEEDYELGDTGLTIPKGMVVGIPVFAMHRDPMFFPEPEKFDPDRFTPEGREKQIPYTYMPFGAGPRNCVAMRFALMELKVCLIYAFSTFRFHSCTETKIPIEFGKGMGLLTPKPITLRLEQRNDCPLKL